MSEDEINPGRLRAIVEAILITAEEPVSPGRLLGLVKEANGRQLREAVDALKSQYDEAGRAFTIVEIAGGFQFASRPEYGPWVRKFHDKHQVRLSQAGLETLAIIAFKQPITRAELDSIRGVNSSGVANHLLELNLIRIVGRSDGVGKPHLFGTTKEFLIHFGLKSLADLPKSKELEELLASGARKTGAADEETQAAVNPEPPEDDALPLMGAAEEVPGETELTDEVETSAPQPEEEKFQASAAEAERGTEDGTADPLPPDGQRPSEPEAQDAGDRI